MSETEPSRERLFLKIGGMQCSFCTSTIEASLKRLNGVTRVAVNLGHEEVLVEYDPGRVRPLDVRDAIRSVGFTLYDPDRLRTFEEEEAELRRERARMAVSGSLTLVALGLMVAMWLGRPVPGGPVLMFILAALNIFGPGWYILQMAASSLRRGILNQHVLLECAAFGGLLGGAVGYVITPWPAADFFGVAVFVTSYHILSGYVALVVRTRSSQAIKRLMDLQPATARVLRDDGSEDEVPVEHLTVGDRVRVRPGERIPTDGVVEEGHSTVDNSLVTGEFIPVHVEVGDEVIGGALNQDGSLVINVSKEASESFLQQVATHIREARALKPNILLLVDRVLKHYVRVVLGAALLAFLLWTVGLRMVSGTYDLLRAIYSTLAVLVMGYPCALGMATPLAIVRGGGRAARRGVLIRSGQAFEVLKDIDTVVFDKTGTLTRGRPYVVGVVTTGSFSGEDLVSLAASVERLSEHPLARAIVDYAIDNGLSFHDATDFVSTRGAGVSASVGGRSVCVGNSRFIEQMGIDIAPVHQRLVELQERGLTVVIVAVERSISGLIAIGDLLKEDGAETVQRLHEMGITSVMITGDNARTARGVAEEVRIHCVYAEVLPGDKAQKVREIQSEGHRVMMVGDGINDAPALMQADVGVAVSSGTDVSIESADVVLVGDRIGGVIDTLEIGRSSYSKTVQNLTLAFLFNGIGVPAAVLGLVHPVWAMVAMAASVTTILFNSFGGRLLGRDAGQSGT